MQQVNRNLVRLFGDIVRDGAGARSQKRSSATKLIIAILLASTCPLATNAWSVEHTAAGPVKAPSLPANTTKPDAATPGFSLAASPEAILLVGGGASKELTVEAAAQNGFKGAVALKVTKLPEGVTATPENLTLNAGSHKAIRLTAAAGAKDGKFTITVSGVSGKIAHESEVSVEVSSTTVATVNTLLFDFGNNLVNNTLKQTAVVVTNTGTATLDLSPTLSGDSSYAIVAKGSCGTSLAAGASCDEILTYKPATASYPKTQDATLKLNFANAAQGVPDSIAITGTSAILKPGAVSATANPQVAVYTITLPFPSERGLRAPM
jgi:hypothetical protein